MEAEATEAVDLLLVSHDFRPVPEDDFEELLANSEAIAREGRWIRSESWL